MFVLLTVSLTTHYLFDYQLSLTPVPAPDHNRWIFAHTRYYSWLSSYSYNSIRCVKEIISKANGGSVDRFKPMKLVDLALG